MVRKLALAVSFALGTLSVPAHALGLGELSSKSSLNQNFQGDITLLSVSPEELDAIRVKLADDAAFARAGVDRPFYLSLLKFEPTLGGGGKTVIRVTSEFPIREPFLNFLIEVNWPNGRLLREYTVLLDPPTTTKRRPPVVTPAPKARSAAPAAASPTAATSAPVRAPAVSADGSEYGPVKANDTAWSIAKRLRPRGVSMEQMMMALLEANPQAFRDNNINRLRRGQILRVPALDEIQQLSRQQARDAYRRQQDEWLARRDEKLQQAAASETSGATDAAAGVAATAEAQDKLRIATARPDGEGEAGAGDDDALSPTASDLKSRLIVARENAETSRQEAETLRSRVDDLQARLADMQKLLSLKDDQLAQLQDRVVTEEAVTAGETPSAEAADIETPAAEVAPPDVTMANQTEAAEVAAPETGVAGEPPATDLAATAEGVAAEVVAAAEGVAEPVIEMADEMPAMAEGAVSPGGDYRIADIPPQIDPDRIVAAADEQGVVPAGMLGGEIVVEGGEVADAAPGDTEVVVIEGVMEAAGVQPETAEPAPAAVEPAPVEPPAPVAEVAEPPAAQAESGEPLPHPLVRMAEQNMLPLAAGGVAILGLVGWLAMRNRRKPQAAPAAVAAAGTAAAGGVATKAAAEPAAVDQPAIDAEALADLPDSAFLDEFSPSDINALQDETGEVDPVSEADVYIAYGRYQQAEELLRQAMNREPDRLALKHKLLEVHYATRNSAAFVALAQEMVDAGQDSADEDAWARAQDMGRELAPDNALFALREEQGGIELAAAGAAATATTAAAAAVDDDTLALDDLEMSELSAAYDEDDRSADDLEAPSEVSITLDLEDPSELAAHTAVDTPDSISLEDLESIDFELPEAEKGAAGQAVDSDEPISESLDLNTMMAEAEAAVDQDDSLVNLDSEFSADELQAQLDELSDLSVLDSDLDERAEDDALEAPSRLGLVAEDSGSTDDSLDVPLSLDGAFDAEEVAEQTSDMLDFDTVEAAAEPADEDDVATKLDLARAYVDMGDEDGARSILEEVVTEGNDLQRGDAEQLLTRLG